MASLPNKIALWAFAIVTGCAAWWFAADRRLSHDDGTEDRCDGRMTVLPSGGSIVAPSAGISPECDAENADRADGQSEDQPDEMSEEERQVDAFYDLTDRWMMASRASVTVKDVETFSKSFRSVPKDRQDECIHRALNLIPDENVMLLAGILMDKSTDNEIIETIFHDILNRDENVKRPIMKEIFKDKNHPCWTDVAWIFEVTGETK